MIKNNYGKWVEYLFKTLGVIFRSPRSLLKVLEDDNVFRIRLTKQGWDNCLSTVDLLEICPDFHETVAPFGFLEGTSLPIDLALLKSLARQFENCKYFEIGTWRGESVANVAEIASECVTLSLSDQEMHDMGISQNFINSHRVFSKGIPNVRHLEGNSLNFDFTPYAHCFDLVFIDGDHTYEGVRSDTRNAFNLLKNDNSIIVWHDYGVSTENVRWSVLAGILDGCPENKRKNLYHISNTMCAVYSTKAFNTSYPIFPAMPNKVFSLDIRVIKY